METQLENARQTKIKQTETNLNRTKMPDTLRFLSGQLAPVPRKTIFGYSLARSLIGCLATCSFCNFWNVSIDSVHAFLLFNHFAGCKFKWSMMCFVGRRMNFRFGIRLSKRTSCSLKSLGAMTKPSIFSLCIEIDNKMRCEYSEFDLCDLPKSWKYLSVDLIQSSLLFMWRNVSGESTWKNIHNELSLHLWKMNSVNDGELTEISRLLPHAKYRLGIFAYNFGILRLQ